MEVRRSALAGSWYPADAGTLRNLVDRFLAESTSTPCTTPCIGFVAPHAGYAYSGSVAGTAYRWLVEQRPERVVVLAPCHRMGFHGIAVPRMTGFETPLGIVWVDDAVRALSSSPLVQVDSSPFEGEHSFEIQLPFLQRAAPKATVVPLLFGSLTAADDPAVESLLSGLAAENTLFLVSTDFTHYGWRFGYEPFPATTAEQVRARLKELDFAAIEPVLAGNAGEFRSFLARTGDTVCGRIPLAAFLATIGRGLTGRLLAYRTSLDVTGDFEHCVSYASIAFGSE